ESTSKNHPQPTEDLPGPKLLVAERAIALEGRSGYIAVVAEGRDEILSGDLTLRGFRGRVTMADELADFLLVSHESEGRTRIAFAGVQSVSGAGELLRLLPMAADRVELERASFNGGRIIGRLQGMGSVALPAVFELKPNVPNPFNPETLIRYALPRASQVNLEVFNAAGQRVRGLVQGAERAGNYQVMWDGRDDSGAKVAGGVYFYRLMAGEFQSIQKMVLVK
ncbi:MAG: T9SS type A sorting domain-containing protein, partial [Gemmatimonadetes bacterium]|nr:T9SS type A sorting domain-containing protein [Gemmatimonadota bacterium]